MSIAEEMVKKLALHVMLKKERLKQVLEHRGLVMCEKSVLSSRVMTHTQPVKRQIADKNHEVKAVIL